MKNYEPIEIQHMAYSSRYSVWFWLIVAVTVTVI